MRLSLSRMAGKNVWVRCRRGYECEEAQAKACALGHSRENLTKPAEVFGPRGLQGVGGRLIVQLQMPHRYRPPRTSLRREIDLRQRSRKRVFMRSGRVA